MDELILALAPAFVAGLAAQRVLELVAGVLDIAGGAAKEAGERKQTGIRGWLADDTHLKWAKGGCAAAVSIAVGIVFALNGVTVLAQLKWTGPAWVDAIATILVVSAGTEGMNSLLKWLGYSKDDAKATEKEAEASKTKKEAEARIAKAEATVAESKAKASLQPA